MKPVNALRNKLKQLEPAVAHALIAHLNDMANKAKQEISEIAASKCKDGGSGYSKSIMITGAVKKGKHVRATLKITHPAAQYIEYGTGLYATKGGKGKIFPRSVKALAFVVQGQQVVVKSEKGQPAKFIYRDAVARFHNTWKVNLMFLNNYMRSILNG